MSKETIHKTRMPEAIQMGQYLSGFNAVEAVHLFGSVAREARGNDLDLVIEVSEPDYEKFLKHWWFRGIWKMGKYFDMSGHQSGLIMEILGVEAPSHPWRSLGNHAYPRELPAVDGFVFPSGWKNDNDALARVQDDFVLDEVDTEFMQKVAADSMIFEPGSSIFIKR